MSGYRKIAVVGAGVVGMSTAVQLQRAFNTAQVTVIAEKFHLDTTSAGAAGLFRPTPAKTPGVPLEVFTQWLNDSWRYFSTLAHSEDAGEAGCQLISGYEYYFSEQDNTYQKKSLYAHEKVSGSELKIYPGPQFTVGYRGTSILTAPRRFLPYLMAQFKDKGGQFVTRKLQSLEELVGQYDLVVNCTALGARELVNDPEVYASRGHVIRVNAPWIKNYLYCEDREGNVCHVYPTPDFVVIGGVRQTGDEDLTPRASDRDAILKRAFVMVPSLKRAEILGEWVGLRPMRKPLRLESEVMRFPSGGILRVVHNFGHGGEGVSLSWGTAAHAVRIAQALANTTAKL